MSKFLLMRRLVLGGALSTLLFAAGVQAAPEAATPSDPVDKRIIAAEVFLSEDRPGLACALIERSHGADTRVPEAVYVLALCSRDQEQWDRSVAYYERLTELLPNASKPKAELAALYLRSGRRAEARQLYREAAALQQDTPAAVLFTQLSRAIVSDDPAQVSTGTKRWQATVSAGLIYDDNLNAGPSATTTAAVIGGVPVELALSPTMRPRDSWGHTYAAGGRYLMPLSGRWAVLYQGNASTTEYFSEDGYDTDSLALGAALIYRGQIFTASLQPNARYVRQESDLQEATHGLSVRLGRQLTRSLQLNGSLGYFDRRVPVADSRDADGYLASAGLSKTFANRVKLGGQYLFQREDAKAESQSRDMHGPAVYAVFPVGDSLQLVGNYRFVTIDYGARQPLFSEAREDEQQLVGVAAIVDLERWTGHALDLVARYRYTRNKSNLAINDYDREVVTVGLQARF